MENCRGAAGEYCVISHYRMDRCESYLYILIRELQDSLSVGQATESCPEGRAKSLGSAKSGKVGKTYSLLTVHLASARSTSCLHS